MLLIVEREREIEAFVPVEYWTIEADLSKRPSGQKKDAFHATLNQIRGKKAELKNEAEAKAVVDDLKGAEYVVESVKKKEDVAPPIRALHNVYIAAGSLA